MGLVQITESERAALVRMTGIRFARSAEECEQRRKRRREAIAAWTRRYAANVVRNRQNRAIRKAEAAGGAA